MSRAFTLIETLITIAFFSVLMIAITQLYITYGRMISFETSSIGAALSANSLIDTTRAAALEADHVVSSHSFAGVPYTSGTTTVVFELPAVDASGIPLSNTYDYISIYASSTNAYRRIDAASGSMRISGTKQLTNALDSLTFTYDHADFSAVTSVTIDATTTAANVGTTTATHLREHVYLRNL